MFNFGRNIPEEMQGKLAATWGARAIFKCERWNGYKGYIDLVWDRQSLHVYGDEDDGVKRAVEKNLVDWINNKGLPAMRKQCESLSGADADVETFDDGPYHIEASPQRSYGYLYIRAWRTL
jgi:hypothetical protein